MKKVILAFALAVLTVSPWALPTIAATPRTVPLTVPRTASAHVQAKSTTVTNGAGTTAAVTLDSSVTSGNLLVCAGASSHLTVSISSSPSNTWVKAVEYVALAPSLTIWTSKSSASGSTTVTLTAGAAFEFRAISCQEISGHDATSDYDKAPAIGTGFGATATSGSTGTLSQANEMAVCFVHTNGTAAVTPSGSFTEPTGGESNTARTIETSYLAVSATTALTCGGTWTGDLTWRAGIITFRDGGAAASFIPGIINAPIRGGGR